MLVAAIRIKKHKVCQGFTIDINTSENGQWFVNKKDILQLVTGNGTQSIAGKQLQLFDLQGMEMRLQKDPWVKSAELYFDTREMLHIRIDEREPVARIFTTSGNSYYIDSAGVHLPLSAKQSARVPVFTGFPSDKKQLHGADSLLQEQMKQMSWFIMQHPFWMSQIAQVDITPKRNFELVPVVGNHIIEFGDGNDYEKKFKRLMVFYRQVLRTAGMDRYPRINVQYAGEVIGIRPVAANRTDSLKAAANARNSEKPSIHEETVKRRNASQSNPSVKSNHARKPKALMRRLD